MKRALFVLVTLTLVGMSSVAAAQLAEPEGQADSRSAESAADNAPTDSPKPGGQTPVEYRFEGRDIIIDRGNESPPRRVETPCQEADMAQMKDRLYLSCGSQGVYVLEIEEDPGDLLVRGFHRFDGRVTGLLEMDDQIWAAVERVEARPLGSGQVLRSPVDTGAAEMPPSRPPTVRYEPQVESPVDDGDETMAAEEASPTGEVIDVEPGVVIVNLGTTSGLERGDHVELYNEERVELGADEMSTRIRTEAIGSVVAVSKSRARIELGLGERVDEHAKARPTGPPLTSYPTAPPRIGGLWEASFALRPFLALRTVGVGTVSSGRLVYRFDGPYAIHANALPLSGGLAREGNVSAVGADVAFAYDARVFSLGLGAGAAQIGVEALGGIDIVEQAGLTITQFGRIGARDGLNLRLHNSFIVANREFFFAGADATVQVPIDSVVTNSWLIFHGGGHVAGQFLGEAGLRLLVRGNGDRGSLFVTPTVGGGLVSNEKPRENCTPEYAGDCIDPVSYGGPLIGLELEWRL